MTPKKVWGVIIIVLGILCFLNGAMICAEVESNTEVLKMLDQQLSTFTGENTHTSTNLYKKLTENEQTRGVTNSLLGIVMAIIGTLMLSDEKKKHISNDHTSNFTNSNEEPAVKSEIKETKNELIFAQESQHPELKETDNFIDSIPIDDKPKVKAAKVINMQSGKNELESEETKWMRPEDKVKMLKKT